MSLLGRCVCKFCNDLRVLAVIFSLYVILTIGIGVYVALHYYSR